MLVVIDESLGAQRAVYGFEKPLLHVHSMTHRLTVEDCFALLEFRGAADFIELRTSAFIAVAYGCGAERHEILALTRNDIQADALIQIRGRNERSVALPERAGQILRLYLEYVETMVGPNDPIFCDVHGNPISPAVINCALTKRSRALGLPVTAGPRLLRAACAAHLIANRMDIRAVATLLGMKHVNSVQVLIGAKGHDND